MSVKDGILDLTIKKHWFFEIKSGRKTNEYRNYETWKNKLSKTGKYNIVRFRLGQTTKTSDINKVLYGKIKSITVKQGIQTDLKCKDKVFDIEFALI